MSIDKNTITKLTTGTKREGGAGFSKGLAFLGGAVIIFLILIVASMGSFLQVDQGERGVVLRNGKLVRVAEPGLDFKVPFFDTVRKISVRDHTVRMQLEAYSFDQQSASMVASVTYRVPETDVAQLYSEYGSLEALEARLLERKALDVIKNVFGKYTAAQSIQNREKLGADINEAMRVTLESAPLQMMGVQVEEVSFSKLTSNRLKTVCWPRFKLKPPANKKKRLPSRLKSRWFRLKPKPAPSANVTWLRPTVFVCVVKPKPRLFPPRHRHLPKIPTWSI